MATARLSPRKFKKAYMSYGGTYDPNDPTQRTANSTVPAAAGIASAAGSLANYIPTTPSGDGHVKGGAVAAKDGLKGAAEGAEIGSVIPGVGTVIGGAVGLVGGVTAGLISAGAQNSRADAYDRYNKYATQLSTQQRGDAMYAANPNAKYGNSAASNFADGGTLPIGPPTKSSKPVPIVVSDPKDPGLKAYNDSLKLYNNSVVSRGKLYKNFDFIKPGPILGVNQALAQADPEHRAMEYGNFSVTKFSNGSLAGSYPNQDYASDYPKNIRKTAIKPTAFQPEIPSGEKYSSSGKYDMDAVYKKPNQPVVYQKPVPTTPPVPTLYGADGNTKPSSSNPLMTVHKDGTYRQWGNATPPPVNVPVSNTPTTQMSDKALGYSSNYYSPVQQNKGKAIPEIQSPTGRYAKGGTMKKAFGGQLDSDLPPTQQVPGGSLTPMNSTTTQVNGDSHAQGGVQLPQAEVEGGETISNGFVFSKELGFADIHKPIARAIGKIEQKPMNPVRRQTLGILKGRELGLAMAQESIKHAMGLPSDLTGGQ